MNERELKLIGAVAGVGLLLFVLMNGAYDRGYSAGVAQGDNPNAVFYDHGPGPLPILLIAGAVLFFLWRRRASHQQGGPNGGFGGGPISGGSRGPQPPRFFQEWHAQAHAGGPQVTQPAAPQAQAQHPDPMQGPAMPPPPPAPPTDDPNGGMPPTHQGPNAGNV